MFEIPAKIRKVLYTVQYITTGATGLVAVGYGAASHALPQWYGISVAVLSAGWTYLGMTASAHVPDSDPPQG